MILSTNDHHDTMQNVAAKSSAQVSLIPSVSDISLETNSQDGATDTYTSLQGILGSKIEGVCLSSSFVICQTLI